MDYTLKDLLDIPRVQALLDSLNEIRPLPSAVIDKEGTILITSAWQDICTQFHRAHPDTNRICQESDKLRGAQSSEETHTIYRCPLGLVDTATPIIIEGKLFGSIFMGQLFLDPPDESYFIRQACQYGFTANEYLTAVRKVPRFTEEQLQKNLVFIGNLAQMLAEQGLQALRQLVANEALQKSEERWKFALESAGDGLWDWDVATNLVYFSRQWKNLLGYRDYEISGTLEERDRRIHPDDKPGVHAALERHFHGETETYFSEHRALCKDGSYRWFLDRGKVIEWTDEGRPRRVIGIFTDISDRKRAEAYRSMGQDILLILNEDETQQEAIQRIIGLLKSVIGVDAVGIRLQNEDDYPYFYQEGFSQEFLHKENSLLTRMQDGGICRDECGNVSLECTCGLVITGKTDPNSPYFTSGGSCWTNDAIPLPKELDPRTNPRDECLHQGFASVALIPIRAKGRNVGLLQLNDRRKGCFTLETIETLEDTAKNIGEAMLRKQAEEKLIASERFLRMLTDQLPGMVGYWSDELRCTFANKGYLEWFGKTPQEMMGISMQELMGEELFRLNEPYMRNALQGKRQHFERTQVKPSGETGYTWAQYIPDMVDGRAKGFFVLVSDVTELKQAEEEKLRLEAQLLQAQKIESVGRLAGGVAHDFNNMLSVILGHSEIALMRAEPGQPLYASLQEISKAAQRSADLTRQLLAFARKQTVSPKLIDLNDVVAGMLKMLQRLIGENIHLSWQPAPNLWPVMMDPSQLDQIMANLCVNSRDAIADIGTITIETGNCSIDENYCSAHPYAVPGDYVRIVVCDNGNGMDSQTMEHIFEPFFTTKAVGVGTGLGLATVYGIVRQNGGFIDITSEPGNGATFAIHLPRSVAAAVPADEETATESCRRGHETILLVEDEPAILKMTSMILTELEYTVLKASSPKEALRQAHEHKGKIDLLVVDVIMPDMNGRDLAKKLLAIHPQMKCLFMSGYTADIIAHHGVLAEGYQFIQKPFRMDAFAAKLREVLDSP